MSRRESRVSMGARQTDTLTEFENFKKKFLQANKQITKLNSTMSQRIEELNAQISTLYNENLRLRASEIALATELKRERDKSLKIMEEVETAALGLTKHFGFLRQTFSIPHTRETPSPTPSPPRATRKPSSSPPSPSSMPPRLSREPTVPGIDEEDEPPSPRREKKHKSKPRLSASKLPLPSRATSPPSVDLAALQPAPTSSRKKPSRRQSGIFPQSLPIVDERTPTAPVTPPPDDDIEECVVLDELKFEEELDKQRPVKPERRRKKDRDDGDAAQHKKPKFKDLTNEPRRPSTPLDLPGQSYRPRPDNDAKHFPADVPSSRQFLASSPPRDSLPTPQPSVSPEPELEPVGGRRSRKSVNYAEPKLNTKMRRPDSVPPLRKQRVSSSAIDDRKASLPRSKGSSSGDEDEADEDGDRENEEAVAWTERRRAARKALERQRQEEDEQSDGDADADEEYAPSSFRTGSGFVNVGRRKGTPSIDRRHSLVL